MNQPNIILTPPGPPFPSTEPRHSQMDLYLRLNIHGTSNQYQKFAELIRLRKIGTDTTSALNDRYRAPPQPYAVKYNEDLAPFFDIGRDGIKTYVVPAVIANVPQVLVIPAVPNLIM
jgi:hypothetical protein